MVRVIDLDIFKSATTVVSSFKSNYSDFFKNLRKKKKLYIFLNRNAAIDSFKITFHHL